MSNVLKMELQESIKVLHRKGWSHRRIASELGVNRRTVKRYCCDSSAPTRKPGLGPKVPNPQTGNAWSFERLRAASQADCTVV